MIREFIIEDSTKLSWKDRQALVVAVATYNTGVDFTPLLDHIGQCPPEDELKQTTLPVLQVWPTNAFTDKEQKEYDRLTKRAGTLEKASPKDDVDRDIRTATLRVIRNHLRGYEFKRYENKVIGIKAEIDRLHAEGACGVWVDPDDFELLSWYYGVALRTHEDVIVYDRAAASSNIERYIVLGTKRIRVTMPQEDSCVLVWDRDERAYLLQSKT